MQERLFTTDQVADLLGTTSREVRQWIAKGWLPRHAGPDGVDRVSETGLIKFLKGRGIDIMQLMVSTAVDSGYRVGPANKSEDPDIAPPTHDAELLGEAASGGPRPEVISASDGPAGPSIDEDVASALVAREMLTGKQTPKDTQKPAPLPSLDHAGPREHSPASPAHQAPAAQEPTSQPTPAEEVEAATKAAAMNARSATTSTPTSQAMPKPAQAWMGFPASVAKPSQILEQEELTALLGSAPGAGKSGKSGATAEAPEDSAEPDDQQDFADEDGPFRAGVYEAEPPIEEHDEPLQAQDAQNVPTEQVEPDWPDLDEQDEQDEQNQTASEQDFEDWDQVQDLDEEEYEDQLPDDEPSPEVHAGAVAAQVISAVLDDAVKRGATHVHLHSTPSGPVLRLRIDGRLREKPNFRRLPDRVESLLAGRLLELAGLAGADLARPQSGQFTHEVDGAPVRMKLSSFPTTHGPRLAVTLPAPVQTPASLAQLGARLGDAEHIHRLLTSRRGGLLLVCGPTADDRAGALRALAGQLTNMGRDVLVINAGGADVPDASNSRLDPVAGYRFRDAARHLTDQDADAIVLAQLRDPTTANAAIEVALAGTMVIAGIPAGTAAEALGTLAEMDVESWPLATMLRGVIVCRTLRKLCEACRRPVRVPRRLPTGVQIQRDALGNHTYAPVGCLQCGRSGYDGKVRLLSLLRPDRQIVRLVRVAAAADTIAGTVRDAGTSALMELAAEYIRAGDVSLDELVRLT